MCRLRRLPDICLANKTCEKALEMKEEYDKCVITFTAIFLLNLAIILAILGQLFEKKGRKGKFLRIFILRDFQSKSS